jgi:translocator protein
MGRQIVALVVCLVIVFAAGMIGAPFTVKATKTWYREIPKPAWTPPDWAFAPVWTALYAAMGVAAWLVWRQGGFAEQSLALWLFIVQLLLNASWTPVFFGLRAFGAAFGLIALLWVAILATTIVFFRVSGTAGALMIPYLAWVSYASTLNYAIAYGDR